MQICDMYMRRLHVIHLFIRLVFFCLHTKMIQYSSVTMVMISFWQQTAHSFESMCVCMWFVIPSSCYSMKFTRLFVNFLVWPTHFNVTLWINLNNFVFIWLDWPLIQKRSDHIKWIHIDSRVNVMRSFTNMPNDHKLTIICH